MNHIISRRKFLAATATAGAVSTLPLQIARANAAESVGQVKKNPTDNTTPPEYKQPIGEGALQIASLEDLEQQASKVIPAGAFAFISQGADNQVTLHDNRDALKRIRLLPHYRELLKRAKAAGYSAIVFTIDAFAPGASDETVRLGFSFPQSLPLVNSGGTHFKSSLGWDDVEFIQETTDLPLILKGVVTPELAEKAIKYGVAGIQVSNHGGRGLDGVPAAIDLLPDVVAAVNKRVPVIFDSGIRRGTDVFKALALGADAVALGRPVLYGLALGGSDGVKSVYDRIAAELSRAMMIAGVASIKDIDRRFIYNNAVASLT